MVDLPNIKNITVSGRIASGSTSLARGLSRVLGWKHIEGGEIFWEQLRNKLDLDPKDTNKRPDQKDEDFDSLLRKMLQGQNHLVLETKLAGFNAQGIPDIFKILVICEDRAGNDQAQIRIDRLVNREKLSIEDAKQEVLVREKNDIEKWRRLYANNNSNWVYWDKKYYDLVVNTYSNNQDQALKVALSAIGYHE